MLIHPRRVSVLLISIVIALVLAACADDSTPDTTSPDTAPATTEAPATTSAPPTTDAPTTTAAPTTSSAPPTTEAPAEPELTEAAVEEGLERPFPVSAGWIVESGEQSLTVGLSVGPETCYGLASAEAEETADEVRITMTAGFRPDASGCGDVAPNWTHTFDLDEPIGDKVVVDAHTGQELGTEPPDAEA